MSRSARRLALAAVGFALLAAWAVDARLDVVPGPPVDDAARGARPDDAQACAETLAAAPREVARPATRPGGVDPSLVQAYDPNTTARGRVLDEAGRPVAGASVESEWDVDGEIVRTPPVATGADGSFVLRVVNDDLASATVVREGYRPFCGTWPTVHGAVVRLVREDRSRVRLRFTGHVPADGTVRVLTAPGADRPDPKSDEGVRCAVRDGVAELPEPVVPDTWSVLVLADGGAAGLETVRVTEGPGVVEIPFEIRALRRLTVRVVDAGGAPVADVGVAVHGPWRTRSWTPDDQAKTSSDGVATLRCVDVPPLTLSIPGFPGESQVVPPGTDEIRFVARPWLAVAGRVTGLPAPDERDAGPTAIPVFEAQESNPLEPEAAWVECRGDDPGAPVLARTTAGKDGRFVLTLPDRGLPERVRLRASAGVRHGPWTQVEIDRRSPARDVEVAAPPLGETFEGHVWDTDGRPCRSAAVEIEAEMFGERRWHRAASTDATGRFRFGGVPPGEWNLRATWGEVPSAPHRARTGGGPLVLVLPRPGTVVGRIASRWRPLPRPLEVLAHVEGLRDPPPVRWGATSSSSDYTIEGVTPGRVRVYVRSGPEAGVSEPFDLPSGGRADAGEVRMEPGAVLVGRTVGASRPNLPVVVCDPRLGYRRTVFTDLEGRFRAEGLWEGTWYVGLAPLVSPQEGTAVAVERGRTHEVTVLVR